MRIEENGTIVINKNTDTVEMLGKEMEITTERGLKFVLPYEKIKPDNNSENLLNRIKY